MENQVGVPFWDSTLNLDEKVFIECKIWWWIKCFNCMYLIILAEEEWQICKYRPVLLSFFCFVSGSSIKVVGNLDGGGFKTPWNIGCQ